MAHELLVDKLSGFGGTLLEMGILLLIHASRSEWGKGEDIGLEDCSGLREGWG